jgi:molecular chaperone GrpE
MSEPGGDWKQRALDDFRQWLDTAGEEPPAHGESDAGDCDLRDLFAEFAALRQEIRLQNREQARAGRELAAAAERYDTAARQAARCDETLAAFEQRVSRTAEDRCLLQTLEVRDALVRGRDAAVRLRDRPRLFTRPPRGAAGVVEGYELAISRFDRMLSRFDVRPVQTVGRPFDSRVMHAVEARRVGRIDDGVVVEELRSGFVRRDDVLRLADVAVNRRHEEG